MKKSMILDLIQAHVDGNETAFRNTAYEIAREFDETGDSSLAAYIMAQLGGSGVFVPQDSAITPEFSDFFRRVPMPEDPFPIPKEIEEDVRAVARAVTRPMGVNKFLFYGAPGTGKTEAVRHIARLTGRELYAVDFSRVVDSRLGQTARNITAVFDEMNRQAREGNLLFLFDEIDALALDRTNVQDLREMGRATSTVLRMLDELDGRVMLIATTNLQGHFDKALLRRFDATVNFDRYPEEDLIEIASRLVEFYLQKFNRRGKKAQMIRKIFRLKTPVPYPGELKNLIKRSIVFSSDTEEGDYLRRLYKEVTGKAAGSLEELKAQGFTVREMEILTGRSKSQVGRELKEILHG